MKPQKTKTSRNIDNKTLPRINVCKRKKNFIWIINVSTVTTFVIEIAEKGKIRFSNLQF